MDMDAFDGVGFSINMWLHQKTRQKMNHFRYRPFFLEFASGNVEPDLFERLRAQESIFRKQCAKIYVFAIKKYGEDVAASPSASVSTPGFMLYRLQNFPANFFLLPPESEPKEEVATFRSSTYVQYVTREGELGGFDSFLASIIPYLRVLKYLVETEIAKKNPHRYTNWISDYSCVEFDASIKILEELLDEVTGNAEVKHLRDLFKVYNEAAQLVIELLCGLTDSDFVPLIKKYQSMTLHLGFDVHVESESTWSSTLFFPTQATTDSAFRELLSVDQQGAEDQYETSVKKLVTAANFASQKKAELGYEHIVKPALKMDFSIFKIEELMTYLSNLEVSVTDQLIESKILEGIEKKHIEIFGKKFAFQSSQCANLLNEFGNKAYVISSSFLGANLLQGAFQREEKTKISEDVTIHGNNLLFEENRTTGGFERNVISTLDKYHIFQNAAQNFSVYVGEVASDLLNMLHSNIGVLIEPNERLLVEAKQLGISFLPLYSALLAKTADMKAPTHQPHLLWPKANGLVYTTTWDELSLVMLGEDGEDTDDNDDDDDEEFLEWFHPRSLDI